jgi:hypothetical protein
MRGKTHHHHPAPWYTSEIPLVFTAWPIHSRLTARTSWQGGQLNPKRPPPRVTAVNRRQPKDTCLDKLIKVRFFELTSCGLDPKLIRCSQKSRQPLFDITACTGTYPGTHQKQMKQVSVTINCRHSSIV